MSPVRNFSCRVATAWSFLLAAVSAAPVEVHAQRVIAIAEIGPKRSDNPTNPNAASGGRVNGLAIARTDNRLMYAASEWGGLFRSSDGGTTWDHVRGHVPHATWDVKIDPSDDRRVHATSFYDGRVDSRAGINISTDGGETWRKPATAAPPAGFCALDAGRDDRRNEPSAFGIAIDPDDPAKVYIGTNCGLAISGDRGETWVFVDPSPEDSADDVWSVIVHHGGIIDICGDDGHRRSTDGGRRWSGPSTALVGLTSGRCSITASPDESNVLFAVVGTTLFESNDGGQSWQRPYANPEVRAQGRIPFVAVNKRSEAGYDLWYGDVGLYRRSCTTPASPGTRPSARCAGIWSTDLGYAAGAHSDVGNLLFDSSATVDACPLLFSNDGGVYFNTNTTSPGCHAPAWSQPARTPQALWNWAMAGANTPGLGAEDLYFGNQDTGSFGTRSAAADRPSWTNPDCCDVFDVAADLERVLYTVCCYRSAPATRLFKAGPGMTSPVEVNAYPPGRLLKFKHQPSLAAFALDSYVIVTSDGAFVTTNIDATPISWTRLGAASPANACSVAIARSGDDVTFFVRAQAGGCDGDLPGQLWRYDGTSTAGAWQPVNVPTGQTGFGVYGVDPYDPNRILAAALGAPGGPAMVLTTNGGTDWTPQPDLDTKMTAGGVFQYQNRRGPQNPTNRRYLFRGYPQPTLVAFDSRDRNVIVAGGADSGVFITFTGGASWRLITDPMDPGSSGIPHIPRPRFAHFEYYSTAANIYLNVYIGSHGRGQWRISVDLLASPPPGEPGGDICPLFPWGCGQINHFPERVDLRCLRTPCELHDPLPLNCIFKWAGGCPGCTPDSGALCPPIYNLVFEGLGNAWDVTLLDKRRSEVKYNFVRVGSRAVLSFRPEKGEFQEGAIGRYVLVFRMNRSGKVGVTYSVKSTLHVSNTSVNRAKLRALIEGALAVKQ